MPPITVNIPNNVLDALNQREGSNLSAKVAEFLAKGLGVDYIPAKRGGQRIPKALTAEQIAKIEIIPTPLSPATAPTMPAVLDVKKKRFVRTTEPKPTEAQHATPLNPNMTLATVGCPYAEIFKANNRYTGKLFAGKPALPRPDCRYENVGSMTLGEFEEACGRKAAFEGVE